jgi:hypothetical protein
MSCNAARHNEESEEEGAMEKGRSIRYASYRFDDVGLQTGRKDLLTSWNLQ